VAQVGGQHRRPAPVLHPWARRRRRWLMCIVLAFAGTVIYANALRQPFMFDDMSAIVDNDQIRRLATPRVLVPDRERPVSGRPLVNLSFAANYAAGGINPWGYHVVNLAIHVMCALVLMVLVGDTLSLGRIPSALRDHADVLAFVIALLWLLHPLNSEVVTYVTQRTESMMALCFLLTLYASMRAQ
jgi:hypothetical protein